MYSSINQSFQPPVNFSSFQSFKVVADRFLNVRLTLVDGFNLLPVELHSVVVHLVVRHRHACRRTRNVG